MRTITIAQSNATFVYLYGKLGVNMSERHLSTGDECPPLKKDTLRVYNMRFCPFAERTILTLKAKGIPHEVVNVNTREKPQWFFDKNPKGLVPVLEINDKIVFESAICCEYLDEVYPENPMTSKDPYQRARDKMSANYFDDKIMSVYWKAAAAKGQDAELKEEFMKRVDELEEDLKKRTTQYFGGENPNWLDIHMWPFIGTIEGVEILGGNSLPNDRFPVLCGWVARMREYQPVKDYAMPPEIKKAFRARYRTDSPIFDGLL
ncbi:glutathione S-transferase omega-1-like isoform X2 [Ptychodera flava]|uniref:glutathione S-transferase omega-1-like isoform X2 n=3 Tax=Ptychodera flava TaxID=63121 RepID=UPI00396A5511